jgi:hypothetical protein
MFKNIKINVEEELGMDTYSLSISTGTAPVEAEGLTKEEVLAEINKAMAQALRW